MYLDVAWLQTLVLLGRGLLQALPGLADTGFHVGANRSGEGVELDIIFVPHTAVSRFRLPVVEIPVFEDLGVAHMTSIALFGLVSAERRMLLRLSQVRPLLRSGLFDGILLLEFEHLLGRHGPSLDNDVPWRDELSLVLHALVGADAQPIDQARDGPQHVDAGFGDVGRGLVGDVVQHSPQDTLRLVEIAVHELQARGHVQTAVRPEHILTILHTSRN